MVERPQDDPMPTLDSIAYRLRGALYLNITNRCTAHCGFCPRQSDFNFRGQSLQLGREPAQSEIIAAIGDPREADEVVFCGYGEPTIRLGVLCAVADWLAKNGARRVRLNTNGHGNLIHKRDILPDLTGRIDAISISLNSADPVQYAALMGLRERGMQHFDAMVDFARRALTCIPEVTMTVVALPGVDVERARAFVADRIGAQLRVRPAFPSSE